MSAHSFPPASFFGSPPPPGFDPASLLQGLAQSDLPSFIHDVLANLATAAAAGAAAAASSASPQAAAQGDTVIPSAGPSSSSPSSPAAASKAAASDASIEASSSSSSARRPRLDLSTTATSPTMTAVLDLPGLAKSDVSIALQPGKLVVSAQRRSASSSTAKGKGREDDASEAVEWQVRERLADSVKWERELPLAPGIKPSEIKASMADGVLTITYPKAAAIPDEQQVLIE